MPKAKKIIAIISVFFSLFLLTISQALAAFEPMILAPYKTMDIYLSEEREADFEFTSVGGYWEQQTPPGTSIEAEVRLKVDGEWSEWLELEEEEDFEDINNGISNTRYAMASSNPATAMQYKFIMYGDGLVTPKVLDSDWTFINAEKRLTRGPQPIPKYSSNTTLSKTTYNALIAASTASSFITSRSQWGADESLRYISDGESVDLIKLSDEFYEEFAEELTLSRTVEQDQYGKKYRWPLEYPTKIRKVVVHHTATTKNLDDPEQAIRDIYYYHAVTRRWGDIGYNYIIDQQGKIYEGRYGGEGVIGAHSGPGNNGSIGIAVLGNYESSPVPETVISSLSRLISQKAQFHKIEPKGFSNFRGELMPNIFAHKDISATTCPGIYLYEKLPVIRNLSSNLSNQKEKFVIDYDYIDHSEIFFLDISPDEFIDVELKFENIGKKDWNDETYIVVNKNPAFDGFISFPTAKSYVLAEMEESLVKPGEFATFKFKIRSYQKSSVADMRIAPIINGSRKIEDYKLIPVSVQQTNYRYEFVSSKYPDSTMEVNEEFTGWVKLKNTGNTPWYRDGEHSVVLGTDHYRDRLSRFVYPFNTRIAHLQESVVQPGAIGTFTLKLKAPKEAGVYKEYFTPVVEAVTWMPDSGMYFNTTVYSGLYGSELISITDQNTWQQGKSYKVWAKIRNLGQTTWTQANFNIDVIRDLDIKVSSKKLLEEFVTPGNVATIELVATIPDTYPTGFDTLLIKPTVSGNNLRRLPIRLNFSVSRNPNLNATVIEDEIETKTGSEGDIRVKVSFSGNPEITANGSFEVYSGNDLITTLNAGQTAAVSYVSGQYKVTTASKTYNKSSKIRFVPKNASILEIQNYAHHPAWSPDLNDNQYRGIIELQYVDGALAVINEIPLEDYLKGLGESSNSELLEKTKSIMVAARTYAKYYMDIDEKFPGKPYNLDDDPAVSQKYLGYGLEKRSPNVSKAVDETRGQMVTYGGEIVKTPYFNQTDGTRTKSALSVWGWKAGYLLSVEDTYCDGDVFLGHGVGLSGCGARGMAEAGFNYIDILKHYYTKIEITDFY